MTPVESVSFWSIGNISGILPVFFSKLGSVIGNGERSAWLYVAANHPGFTFRFGLLCALARCMCKTTRPALAKITPAEAIVFWALSFFKTIKADIDYYLHLLFPNYTLRQLFRLAMPGISLSNSVLRSQQSTVETLCGFDSDESSGKRKLSGSRT
jgi:hypothetical protein